MCEIPDPGEPDLGQKEIDTRARKVREMVEGAFGKIRPPGEELPPDIVRKLTLCSDPKERAFILLGMVTEEFRILGKNTYEEEGVEGVLEYLRVNFHTTVPAKYVREFFQPWGPAI